LGEIMLNLTFIAEPGQVGLHDKLGKAFLGVIAAYLLCWCYFDLESHRKSRADLEALLIWFTKMPSSMLCAAASHSLVAAILADMHNRLAIRNDLNLPTLPIRLRSRAGLDRTTRTRRKQRGPYGSDLVLVWRSGGGGLLPRIDVGHAQESGQEWKRHDPPRCARFIASKST
jgi:hypothetical protein